MNLLRRSYAAMPGRAIGRQVRFLRQVALRYVAHTRRGQQWLFGLHDDDTAPQSRQRNTSM